MIGIRLYVCVVYYIYTDVAYSPDNIKALIPGLRALVL